MDLGASYQQICIGALYRYYFKRYGLWPRYWRGIPRFIEGFRNGEPQPSYSLIVLYRLSTNTTNWFRSYLTNICQVKAIENIYSSCKPVPLGMPQGSILGPGSAFPYIRQWPTKLYLQLNTDVHDHNTRRRKDFHLPCVKRKWGKQLFTYHALQDS